MNKLNESEIRELFFEFTNEQINGIRYLTQDAFKKAISKALNMHVVSNRRELVCEHKFGEEYTSIGGTMALKECKKCKEVQTCG